MQRGARFVAGSSAEIPLGKAWFECCKDQKLLAFSGVNGRLFCTPGRIFSECEVDKHGKEEQRRKVSGQGSDRRGSGRENHQQICLCKHPARTLEQKGRSTQALHRRRTVAGRSAVLPVRRGVVQAEEGAVHRRIQPGLLSLRVCEAHPFDLWAEAYARHPGVGIAGVHQYDARREQVEDQADDGL